MKVLVVGGGSIGRRHGKNLLGLKVETALYDMDAAKTAAFASEYGTPVFPSLDAALSWKPDGVVVATPHVDHLITARKVIESGIDVLIEKPLSNTLEGVSDLLTYGERQKRNIYVVCNMRFHPAIRLLRENLQTLGKIRYAYAYFGEWLETMRPNIDYRTVYAAHKNMGGGLVLDCIHEIDYLGWLFGAARTVSCHTDKLSSLEIDVEDYASLHIKYESGVHAEIHFDYLQRLKRRGYEIVGEKGTLLWANEGKNPEICRVRRYDVETNIVTTLLETDNLDVNQMYVEMMGSFVGLLRNPGTKHDLSTGRVAENILGICMGAYESAKTAGKNIELD